MDSSYFGYIAGALTTVSFIPQVIKAWRTRSTESISLSMFVIFTIGILLWLVYGITIRSFPVIASNAVTLVLSGMILGMKLRYK